MAVAELFAKGDIAGAQAKLHHDMQHYINEVTGERLQEILVHITALARRATQAGADAIEVHGDRLIGSLCSPLINQRTDEYGGSFENRTRFARAVVRAIREGSPDICIDYKLPIITENPQLGRGGLVGAETAEYIAQGDCEVTIVEMMGQIAAEEWPSTPPRLRRTVSRSLWSATATARPRISTAPWRRATWPPPPPDTPDFVRTLMHRDSDIFHRTAE